MGSTGTAGYSRVRQGTTDTDRATIDCFMSEMKAVRALMDHHGVVIGAEISNQRDQSGHSGMRDHWALGTGHWAL